MLFRSTTAVVATLATATVIAALATQCVGSSLPDFNQAIGWIDANFGLERFDGLDSLRTDHAIGIKLCEAAAGTRITLRFCGRVNLV